MLIADFLVELSALLSLLCVKDKLLQSVDCKTNDYRIYHGRMLPWLARRL